ncbi:MAG: LptF/LptG family permease [Phycisphaeraceae bacterium]|nr:LptF/LptG family permease [Phycisphaeraceae bacterium]
MNLLDRMIAKQFLFSTFVLLGCLYAIILVVDLSLNFDDYYDIARRLSAAGADERVGVVRTGAMTAAIFWDLWWPRLFQLFNYMIGVVMVGGMGFTCAQMVKHRELVAMLAGGISLRRVARPIVICALGVTLLQTVNREWIVPDLAPRLARERRHAGSLTLGVVNMPLTADARGRLFYAREADLDAGELRGVRVWERDAQGLMERRILAERAVWAEGAWRLEGGVAEEVRTEGERSVLGRPTPIERYETDLDPTVLRLRRYEGFGNNLSTAQLTELIERYRAEPNPPRDRIGALERIRMGRISVSVCNILTLLLCLPFFLRREPANMLVQSIYASPVALVAMVGVVIGVSTTLPGIPTAVGVFLPAVLLVPAMLAAVTSIRT